MKKSVENELILPLLETPIKYNGLKASRLSISLTGSDEWRWFYSSMIQIESTGYLLNICHEKNPFIYERRKEVITKKYTYDKLWYLICNNINDGIYISALLDMFFVPFREEYLTRHFYHQSLIHGYNSKRRTIFVREFFKHHWTTKEIDYSFFYRAFISNEVSKIYYFKKKNMKFDFNKRKFVKELECYLNSNYPVLFRLLNGHIELSKRVYGINAIKEMINNLRNSNYEISLSSELQMLFEHTKAMIMRLQFLEEYLYINLESEIDTYRSILNNRQLCIFLYIKYELTNNRLIIMRIISNLEKSLDLEIELLTHLVLIVNKSERK